MLQEGDAENFDSAQSANTFALLFIHFSPKNPSIMKNTICFPVVLSLLFLVSISVFSQSSSLHVQDPLSWGWDPATIEEATLVVKPQGVYIEYGLYLTISAKGSNYYGSANTPLEIVLDFCLPENSIIHDSWLWVGNDIMQAILIDRSVASQIYEGIVNRRQDPSILTKTSNGCYQLRIYPLSGNSSRKVKITYLVPARWTRNMVSAPLPIDLLQLSYATPDLKLVVHTDATFRNPVISEIGMLPFSVYSGSGTYTATLPASALSSYSGMEIAYDSPLQNGVFAGVYAASANSGYYQLVVHPQQALNLTSSRKVVVMMEYTQGNSKTQRNEMLSKTKEMLLEYLSPSDSFNLFFVNGNSVQQANANFLPAEPLTVNSVFSVLPTNTGSAASLQTYLQYGTAYIRTHGNDAQLLLVTNSTHGYTYSTSNSAVSGILAQAQGVKMNVVNYDFSSSGNSNYDATVYSRICSGTAGKYVSHQYQYSYDWQWNNYYYYSYTAKNSFSELMHEMFASFDIKIPAYSLYSDMQSGFTHSEIELQDDHALYFSKPYMEVGKYYGSGSLNAELSVLTNSGVAMQNWQFSSPYVCDTLTRKMWAGNFINALERESNYYQYSREIADTSLANRVLSLYTAFLALEPNDTLAACENCEDESGGGGNGATAVVDPDSSSIVLSASPNPFSNSVTITISIDINDLKDAELRIYNMMGQEVKVFRDLSASASQNNITLSWNGEDASGNALPNGVYMAVLITANGKQVLKLVKAG